MSGETKLTPKQAYDERKRLRIENDLRICERTSAQLLPCPFCGSKFLIGQEPHDNHPVAGQFYLYHEYGQLGSPARKCPIDVRGHFDSEAAAIAAWNRRSPLKASQEAEVEPVAWRYRGYFNGKALPWQMTDQKWLADRQRSSGEEVEPLYATPKPSLDTDGDAA